MQTTATTTTTVSQHQQRRDQVWQRDFNRAVRTLNRCEAQVKRLEAAGISESAPEYRRAKLHRDLAWYAYEAVTD